MKCNVQAWAVFGTFLLVGCTQQRYEPIVATSVSASEARTFTPLASKYLDTQSPAWNFQHTLDDAAMQCRRQADMGYILYTQLRDYGSSKRPNQNAQALADCQRYAYRSGDQAIKRLQQSKPSPKALELSKELYAKWFAYISDMTISAPKNTYAQTQYETSKRGLIAEDKFAN